MSVRPLRSLLSQQAIVVTLLPFIIVAALTYFWLLPQIRAEIESRQSELASLVAGQVENYLATAEGTVKGVAAIHLNEDLDWHHMQQVLDAQIEASPALQALYVVGTDGRIIVSGLAERNRGQREDFHGRDLSHTTIFTQVELLHQPVWSDTFLSAVTGKITAAVAIPSHGVTVIGEIDLDRLSQFLTKTGTKEEQLILIIDQRGQVVVDQSGELTAQKLNLNNIPLVKEGTGSAALVSGQFKINDRAMFGTISENPAVKWDILVGRPLDVLYRSALTTMIIFWSGLVTALLLSTSAALYMARRLAVQFEGLANHARKLSLGKIATGWPKGSVTEVEQLANDLAMMADAISAQERQLAESENLLHSVIDHTFHFQGILSADGKVIDINKSACDLVGLSKESVLGCNFWDTRWWQHDPAVQEKVHAAVESCAVHAFVRFWTTHLDASGKIHHIDFSLKSMRDDDNKVLYLIFEGDDITRIVRIKGDLRASEARLQLYFQRLPIASIVWGKDYDVQQWNPAAEKLFGYSATEALGRTADELILLDTDKAETDQIWRQLLEEELTVNSVNDNRTKDGKIITCAWTNTPFYDPQGQATGVISVVEDITEHRQTERRLKESEERFRLIFSQHGAIMLLIDPITEEIIDANISASRFYGYSQAELCSMNIAEVNCLTPKETALERQRVANGEKSFFTFRHRLFSGEVRTVEVHSSSIDIQGQQLLFSIIHDVTERMKIALELVKLSQAVEQSPVTIVITDRAGIIEYVNPKFTQLTGYKFEEAQGQTPRIFKSSLTSSETIQQLWKVITTGGVWEGNLCNRKKNGELYWEHARIAPVTNSAGSITHFVAVKEDITEKIKFEEELKHNVTMFQALHELSLISEESDQVILDYCLEAAVRITRSAIGYIYFMNEDETTLTLHAWSKDVMPACSIPFKSTVYQVAETGLWGEAVRRRSPVITNDYEAPNPLKRGYPQGHVPIKRHMNIPLIIHGKIVLIARVGNKEGGYDEFDVKALTLLMTAMWRMIEANKVKKSLQESEEIFRQMFAQNYDAVILFHPKKLRIIDANAEALALYGLSLEELRKIRPKDLIDTKDFKLFAKNIMPYRDAEVFILTKATCYKASGEKIIASLKGKMIKLKNEEMILCSIHDITQKLRLEEEIKTTQAKLIQTNKMTSLGMLVSGVAHEINNPNHCISINASVLKNIWGDVSPLVRKSGEDDDSALLGRLTYDEVQALVPQLFSGISESSQRISTIVTNMREFVRNGQNSRAGSFDVNKIITSATSILWHHINRHTDSFRSALAENIPLTYGNAQQIEQVVINLLMNALQALPDKSHGVSITTLLDPTINNVVIIIEDEGKGMTPITLERLAEPFFTTREDEGGTGLGLYISMSIIKDYGGSLVFNSELGKGTTATIRLPIATDSQTQHL